MGVSKRGNIEMEIGREIGRYLERGEREEKGSEKEVSVDE